MESEMRHERRHLKEREKVVFLHLKKLEKRESECKGIMSNISQQMGTRDDQVETKGLITVIIVIVSLSLLSSVSVEGNLTLV